MPRRLVFIILNASPVLYFTSILPHRINSFLALSPEYFGEITLSSVILSTSPPSSSVYIILSEAITPSKLSHLVEKMAKTSRSNPDDGSRSVVSRSERYQILEKKRSITATPPRNVSKHVRDKKSSTDDGLSPFSTGTLANSPEPPPGIDWSQIEKVLSPAAEGKEDDDNSDDDGDSNHFASAAKKGTNSDDDYSDDDDHHDGSGYGVTSDNQKNDNYLDGGGKRGPTASGLYYPDDDVLLDDVFDDDYMDKHFSSIPDEPASQRNRNRIMGGPQPPGPNATKEEREAYENKQKAFTDANHCKQLSSLKSVGLDVSPQKVSSDDHTGDQHPHIRLMTLVESGPLLEGHTFAKKETVMIRIGEEANLRNIKVKVLKSCTMQYEVAGDSFYVKASNLMFQGWSIRSLCCRDDDDSLIIPARARSIPEKALRCPFTGQWLGYILCSHLETCPGMSYVHMRGLLSNYVNTDLITDNLLQEARDWAKLQLFGTPDDNIDFSRASSWDRMVSD